jgi:hypothetical protein
MAISKTKRPIPLAQPQRRSPNPEPAELMPVKAHVYRAIAELNDGFEKVARDLQTIGRVNFFPSDRVTAMHDLISRIRAQVNRDFMIAIQHRESANFCHFDRLCVQSEKETGNRPSST